MPVVKGMPLLRALGTGIAVVLAATLCNPAAASAATARLRVLDFNACDQFGRGNAACDATPTQRASAIVQSINSYAPDVVTLQEVCRSTVDMTLGSLGPTWKRGPTTTSTTHGTTWPLMCSSTAPRRTWSASMTTWTRRAASRSSQDRWCRAACE